MVARPAAGLLEVLDSPPASSSAQRTQRHTIFPSCSQRNSTRRAAPARRVRTHCEVRGVAGRLPASARQRVLLVLLPGQQRLLLRVDVARCTARQQLEAHDRSWPTATRRSPRDSISLIPACSSSSALTFVSHQQWIMLRAQSCPSPQPSRRLLAELVPRRHRPLHALHETRLRTLQQTLRSVETQHTEERTEQTDFGDRFMPCWILCLLRHVVTPARDAALAAAGRQEGKRR